MKNNAILVFGMRRSGTTWLAKIVDSHSDTLYRHEPDSWIELPDIAYYPDFEQEAPPTAATLDQFLDELKDVSTPHIVAKSPFFDKSYLNVIQKYQQLIQAFVSKSARRIFGTATACYNAIPTLGDKNFNLVWKSVESPTRLAYIASALPESRALFLIRHPCGYFNSYLRGQTIGKMPRTSDDEFDVDMWNRRLRSGTAKSYDLTLDSVVAWSRKERMIWEWIIDNQFVLESVGELENVKVVVYDELCQAPLQGAKDIFEHLHIDWDSQTESFLERGKKKRREAYFSVYKDPAVTANAWRSQLSLEDQKLVIGIVKETLPARLFSDNLTIE